MKKLIVRGEGEDPGVLDGLSRSGHVYRGMTSAEYEATVALGLGVKSRGDYSLSCEGTCFADDIQTAESYVNFGRDDPRKTGKPTYLVEVKKGPWIKVFRDYPKADRGSAVPQDAITRVWKMSGRGGSVTAELVSVPRASRRESWKDLLSAKLSEGVIPTGHLDRVINKCARVPLRKTQNVIEEIDRWVKECEKIVRRDFSGGVALSFQAEAQTFYRPSQVFNPVIKSAGGMTSTTGPGQQTVTLRIDFWAMRNDWKSMSSAFALALLTDADAFLRPNLPKPIELLIRRASKTTDVTKLKKDFLETLKHELIHVAQYKRLFVAKAKHPDLEKHLVGSKAGGTEADYFAHFMEISAYANEVANTMLRASIEPTSASVSKFISQDPVAQQYLTLLKAGGRYDKKYPAAAKRFLKYVVLYYNQMKREKEKAAETPTFRRRQLPLF